MIPILEGLNLLKNKHRLLTARDHLPIANLGEFAEEYINELTNHPRHVQVQMLCGLIDKVYQLGGFNGKLDAVNKIKEIIK